MNGGVRVGFTKEVTFQAETWRMSKIWLGGEAGEGEVTSYRGHSKWKPRGQMVWYFQRMESIQGLGISEVKREAQYEFVGDRQGGTRQMGPHRLWEGFGLQLKNFAEPLKGFWQKTGPGLHWFLLSGTAKSGNGETVGKLLPVGDNDSSLD